MPHLLFILILLLAPPTQAQTDLTEDQRLSHAVGTASFSGVEYKKAGKLRGCGFEYKIVHQDLSFVPARYVQLTGFFNTFYEPGADLTISFNVEGADMVINLFDNTDLIPFDIPSAYLLTAGASTAGTEQSSFSCGNGGYCAIYRETFQHIFAGLLSNDIEIHYQRQLSRAVARVRIDSVQSEEIFAGQRRGAECFQRLLERFKQQD